jgi:hypothetical protein
MPQLKVQQQSIGVAAATELAAAVSVAAAQCSDARFTEMDCALAAAAAGAPAAANIQIDQLCTRPAIVLLC